MLEPEILVECGRDERGLVPLRFGVPHAMQTVDEILDHWPAEGYEYFKVRCGEATYILRHDTAGWQIHLFYSPGAIVSREASTGSEPR